MEQKKLAALAESMMLGASEADEHGEGAMKIVSNIKRIEEFLSAADADLWEADDNGAVVLSALSERTEVGRADTERGMISASTMAEDGFIVIPRVV